MALTDKLTNIADAIRGKTGGTDAMTLDQMAEAIAGIEAGGGGGSGGELVTIASPCTNANQCWNAFNSAKDTSKSLHVWALTKDWSKTGVNSQCVFYCLQDANVTVPTWIRYRNGFDQQASNNAVWDLFITAGDEFRYWGFAV